MKDKVSELIDGELTNQDAKKIIESLKRDHELQQQWETYHLIGDFLRQPEMPSIDITQRVRQRLESEPILLKPNKTSNSHSKTKIFGYATAASIVAMFTAWLVMNDVYEQSQQPTLVVDQTRSQTESDGDRQMTPMLVSHPSAIQTFPHSSVEDMDKYLFYHNFQNNEFQPGTAVHDQLEYIYPVTDFHNK